MALKIYTENNYIVITYDNEGKEYRGHKKDVVFFKHEYLTGVYNIIGLKPSGMDGISWEEFIDDTNTPFANELAFIDFYTINTGNFGIIAGTPPISTPYITSLLPMIDPAGVFVTKNIYSNGSITYTLQDGTTYVGDTSLLLPYSNSLIEFEVIMSLSANSDAVYDITPAGSEIRDYQIFDLSNPSQDISGQVSGVVSNLHQLRLHTTIAIPQLQIKGTRTKV